MEVVVEVADVVEVEFADQVAEGVVEEAVEEAVVEGDVEEDVDGEDDVACMPFVLSIGVVCLQLQW